MSNDLSSERANEHEFENIPARLILVDEEFNCRGHFMQSECMELAESIKHDGLIQPIIVCPIPEQMEYKGPKKYLLVCGYRRFTAMKDILGWENMPSVINSEISDVAQATSINLSENLNRKNLRLTQEAFTVAKIKAMGLSRDEVASRLGVSLGWLQIRETLLNLPDALYPAIDEKLITTTDIRNLYHVLRIDGIEACMRFAKDIKDAKQRGKTRISKSQIEVGKKKDSKRTRPKQELLAMTQHILTYFGEGIQSYLLAWASGELATGELDKELREYADALDIVYLPYCDTRFEGYTGD